MTVARKRTLSGKRRRTPSVSSEASRGRNVRFGERSASSSGSVPPIIGDFRQTSFGSLRKIECANRRQRDCRALFSTGRPREEAEACRIVGFGSAPPCDVRQQFRPARQGCGVGDAIADETVGPLVTEICAMSAFRLSAVNGWKRRQAARGVGSLNPFQSRHVPAPGGETDCRVRASFGPSRSTGPRCAGGAADIARVASGSGTPRSPGLA